MSRTTTVDDRPSLVVVDDDPSMLSQLRMALSDEFAVETADDPESGWELVRKRRPDLVTLDLALDGKNPETGFSLLDRCLAVHPFIRIVMITGNDDHDNAMRAVRNGAADFLGKPVDVDELRVLLRRQYRVARLHRQNVDRGERSEGRLGEVLAASREMQELFQTIKTIAPNDISVLILGESGTGKGLIAEEIHAASPRASKPLVTIDCGAIAHSLLESELFGHEKGAFTGAHSTRLGSLETANEGTIFLDEVGELPLALQVKLLRFLQTHEVQRIGSNRPIKLNVRVVVATNRKLEEEVKAGRFREDLYYRLSVVNLYLPPLRERPDDIPLLAEHFLRRYAESYKRGPLTFSSGAKDALLRHSWPGNVRELEHTVQKAAVVCKGSVVDIGELGLGADAQASAISLKVVREEAEERAITHALRTSRGNVSRAATLLEVSRPTLYELLGKHGIEARSYRKKSKADG